MHCHPPCRPPRVPYARAPTHAESAQSDRRRSPEVPDLRNNPRQYAHHTRHPDRRHARAPSCRPPSCIPHYDPHPCPHSTDSLLSPSPLFPFRVPLFFFLFSFFLSYPFPLFFHPFPLLFLFSSHHSLFSPLLRPPSLSSPSVSFFPFSSLPPPFPFSPLPPPRPFSSIPPRPFSSIPPLSTSDPQASKCHLTNSPPNYQFPFLFSALFLSSLFANSLLPSFSDLSLPFLLPLHRPLSLFTFYFRPTSMASPSSYRIPPLLPRPSLSSLPTHHHPQL
ncbi:hypothetical protein BIFGAL_03003 [Bifidobacterium gallicum DSM 20093 = LMG 11596]|uniref:Uncharacterized protein n=1 Tax=Bifidobacterium gallicum DSM 20093 = LMG 11596 TaxID=561180 RepID=D1NRQ5_9BIFI|nr:hypothetical protein BIFGAL_03003 [Bifidobacterium gallicum DSM 20093 = LMG 11596]